MEQRGVVIKTENEYAYVRIKRESACGSNCAQCAGCEQGELQIKAKNAIGAKRGDQVRLEVGTGSLLYAAFLVYLLPLLLGLLSGMILYSFLQNSLLSVSFGIFIFLFVYLFIYRYNKKMSESDKYIGNITEILY